MSEPKFVLPIEHNMDAKEVAFAQQMGMYYKDAHPEVQKIWDLSWNAACSAVEPPAPQMEARKHSHYFKACPYDSVDVYRILTMYQVTDPCLQHAIKKLLVAGGRGAGKDISRDVMEAIDTLQRWQEMRREEMSAHAGEALP